MRAHAIALTRPKEPLKPVIFDLPAPGNGEARVRLEACALGLRDWDVLTLDVLPHLPLIAGQEAVGRIEAVGPEVTLAVGVRVAVLPLSTSCAACSLCERGLERWCAKAQWHGFHRDGALTTRGNFAAQHLVPVPEDLAAHQLACLVGSGWSALGALRLGSVGAGQRVALFGCGGVGHLAVQLARALGATVHVVEPDADRLRLAQSLGAEVGMPPGGADLALVCTPSTQAIAQAARGLRRTGTMVLVGSSPTGRFDLSLADTVFHGITLRGSVLGTRSDLTEVLELHRQGQVNATVDSAPLESAVERLWWLRDGGFVGRLVFDCDPF